ncbi:MAG: HNH endonuclease [Acidobacteria bacterium]|nr:HNH endonuclease [Acidobacteriota bacterium]
MPIKQLLAPGSHRARTHVKGRLLRAGLLNNKCYICGIRNWRGRALSLQLDHINSQANDWALENLRLLCLNCHSQTETWGSKNWKNHCRVV